MCASETKTLGMEHRSTHHRDTVVAPDTTLLQASTPTRLSMAMPKAVYKCLASSLAQSLRIRSIDTALSIF